MNKYNFKFVDGIRMPQVGEEVEILMADGSWQKDRIKRYEGGIGFFLFQYSGIYPYRAVDFSRYWRYPEQPKARSWEDLKVGDWLVALFSGSVGQVTLVRPNEDRFLMYIPKIGTVSKYIEPDDCYGFEAHPHGWRYATEDEIKEATQKANVDKVDNFVKAATDTSFAKEIKRLICENEALRGNLKSQKQKFKNKIKGLEKALENRHKRSTALVKVRNELIEALCKDKKAEKPKTWKDLKVGDRVELLRSNTAQNETEWFNCSFIVTSINKKKSKFKVGSFEVLGVFFTDRLGPKEDTKQGYGYTWRYAKE